MSSLKPKKDLTQRLAEQDQWKARNNPKTTNFVEFKNDKNVIWLDLIHSRKRIGMVSDWRIANWMDPNDYDVGGKK